MYLNLSKSESIGEVIPFG